MSDTNALRQRIADELNRQPSDLIGSPSLSVGYVINREVNSAIRHYESMRFRWNEVRESEWTTTTAGTRNYSLPADLVMLDSLKVIDGTDYIVMAQRTWDELEYRDRQTTASDGIPTRFALYGNILRVYPWPDAAYTLVASYQKRFRPSSLTGSYCAVITMGGGSLTATTTASHNNPMNGWTTDAADLIAERAKASVMIRYLHDDNAKAEAGSLAAGREPFLSVMEQQAYQRLADETADFTATGRIQPYCI